MAYSKGGGGKLSAVDAILAEAADLVALERIAKLNTAHLADDSALPSSLESRFRKLKSLPTATTAPVRTLGRSATAPLPHHTNNPPQPNPPAPAAAAPTAQAQGQEDAEAAQEENSPLQAHPPVVTVPAVQEEDLERLFGPGRGRLKLRERNKRDDSPSPLRQACCFGFASPKKSLQRTPTRSTKSHTGGDLDYVLGVGDAGNWGDENRRIVTELKEQQRKLKKALEEQVKVSRETAKMARWVKQASARMTHTAAIDDLLSDGDDDEDLRHILLMQQPLKVILMEDLNILAFQMAFLNWKSYLVVYFYLSARPWPAANWKVYIAFSLFRGASIYAGVYHRWTMGNASGGERARFVGKIANAMVDCAWDFIKREKVLREQPATGLRS